MQTRPDRTRHLPHWGMVALVFGVVLFCYWPAMHGELLWDDPAHVPRPEMRGWDGLWRIWSDVRSTQQYYPVLFSAFWIEHRLWGDSTFGYHLFNALLHATACCLLAGVVRRLGAPGPEAPGRDADAARVELAAWTAALLFAVHPVCVESVAWITEQKNTLSTVFALLATHVYLGFDRTRRRGAWALASVMFLGALGAKTATVVLPPILLVLLWWRHGRLGWRRDVAPLVPWFIVAVAAGLLTEWLERTHIGAEGEAFELTLGQRILLAGRVVWFFLAGLVWPPERAFFYKRWDVAAESGGWLLHLGAAAAITLALWVWRGRLRGAYASWLVLGGALFPVLGFFNVYSFQFAYVADHYYYLAVAGVMASAGTGVAWLHGRLPVPARRAGLAAGVCVLGALALLSRAQSALYVNNETLFRDNIAKVPDSWFAHHILAHTLAKDPARRAEAIAQYREALRHKPDLPDSHLGLANELARDPATRAEAITHYARAIELRPHYLEALNNFGLLLSGIPGREAEAERRLREALALVPRYQPATLNLARLLARQPARHAEAIELFSAIVAARPEFAEARHSLAVLLIQTPGREVESLVHFEAAARLEPRNPDALNSLAIAYAQTGRLDLARLHWQRALEVDPRFEPARDNLRRLEQMQGR